MPKLNFGEKASFESGKGDYLELNSKGDKVHVRFLGAAVYEGKHFLQQPDGKWNVSYCPRIMNSSHCSYCESFFEAKKAQKAMGDYKALSEADKEKFDNLGALAKKYSVAISFYYPVLDRATETARILKCGVSTRSYLDTEANAGIKILDFDYVITRLKGKITDAGSDWYSHTRLDSGMIEPLTDKEIEEVEKAESWDIEKTVYGTKASSFDPTNPGAKSGEEDQTDTRDNLNLDKVLEQDL